MGNITIKSSTTTHDNSHDLPPPASVLQGKRNHESEAFLVNEGDSESSQEIKVMVEFPTYVQQERPNDIAMYLKRFATVLLSAHPSIAMLNWENPGQSPAKKAIDISPNEETICQYFSGMLDGSGK